MDKELPDARTLADAVGVTREETENEISHLPRYNAATFTGIL
jgi:hypothetical protein